MQMLYAKAAAHNSQCTFVEFSTGMHMDTWVAGGGRYWRTIQLFLEENVPEKRMMILPAGAMWPKALCDCHLRAAVPIQINSTGSTYLVRNSEVDKIWMLFCYTI